MENKPSKKQIERMVRMLMECGISHNQVVRAVQFYGFKKVLDIAIYLKNNNRIINDDTFHHFLNRPKPITFVEALAERIGGLL